ncbi:MAG: 30S ribosomal protein S12 methylthiotransferase RimO [bacterium]
MKVNLISLGCPKNLVDSEKLLGALGAAGVEICAIPEYSDVIIINTCAFIEPAIVETEEEIKKALAIAKNKKVYVHGCAVNRYAKRLKNAFPGVAGFFSLEQNEQLVRTIQINAKITRARLLTTQGYAYLKIADGCSNRCSYCTIPMIKGAYKSADFNTLLRESAELAEIGVKELILIAQDTTAYGQDLCNKPMLVELIRGISKIPGIEWIRIMYTHPMSLNDEIIDEIKTNKKVCKYIDLPIQHINDRILKLMNRHATKQRIQELFAKLGVIDEISIRTTVIVGFPTETEDEFKELFNFVKETKIDWLGVFSYFCEHGTQAAEFKQVPGSIINQRYEQTLALQQALIEKNNRSRLGKVYKTLVHHKNSQYVGHTEHACPDIDSNVLMKNTDLRIGEFCTARFSDVFGYDVCAETIA